MTIAISHRKRPRSYSSPPAVEDTATRIPAVAPGAVGGAVPWGGGEGTSARRDLLWTAVWARALTTSHNAAFRRRQAGKTTLFYWLLRHRSFLGKQMIISSKQMKKAYLCFPAPSISTRQPYPHCNHVAIVSFCNRGL